MEKKRLRVEQIVAVMKETEASMPVAGLIRRVGILRPLKEEIASVRSLAGAI